VKKKKINDFIFNGIKNHSKSLFPITFILILILGLPILLYSAQQRQNITHQAQTAPQGVYGIYGQYDKNNINTGNTLAAGWTEEIQYGATSGAYDLVAAAPNAPTYCGTHSISWTITSGSYEQLTFKSPTPVSISPYTYLTFFVQASMVNQGINLGAVLLDQTGNPFPELDFGIPIANYGGVPVHGDWYVYNIPLLDFGIPSTTIGGIGLRDLNGGNHPNNPPLYIDEINLSTQRGEDIYSSACTSPGQQIIPNTIIPTPAMPYYPDISPWIYIIPAIIIGLAVIFQ
jgi:hypothetical protein